ncbi:hypothetical protein P171DRAFT_185337 [Karstenula rhodostoma CBS 690.94]|uniref:Uncharacterized protein n=1 Tax=Karstenula rhodostoma CBS 690.94 TaxID=1392251 RepID=A0A9P4P2Q9_9PLEO|nr:hypothetical protein P171DRAFT_185337 [Karstenula rhodostoma CBS 690.94]
MLNDALCWAAGHSPMPTRRAQASPTAKRARRDATISPNFRPLTLRYAPPHQTEYCVKPLRPWHTPLQIRCPREIPTHPPPSPSHVTKPRLVPRMLPNKQDRRAARRLPKALRISTQPAKRKNVPKRQSWPGSRSSPGLCALSCLSCPAKFASQPSPPPFLCSWPASRAPLDDALRTYVGWASGIGEPGAQYSTAQSARSLVGGGTP